MRLASYLIIVIAVGCTPVAPVAVASPFVGVWEADEIVGVPSMPTVSELCRSGTLELRADGVAVGVSAEQVSTSSYVVEHRGSESFLVQRDVKFNDRPNCQGLSPDFVRDHYLTEARIEIVGDRMKMYPSPAYPDIYLTFRRKGQ